MKVGLVCIICFIFIHVVPLHAQEVKISANEIIHSLFNQWPVGINCVEFDNYARMSGHRGELELLLICKALHKGGMPAKISVTKMPNYSRALEEAKDGNFAMPAETIWRNEVDTDKFYMSIPILEEGEVELGIYVSPFNKEILRVDSLEGLQKYRGVSSDKWIMNWATLNAMRVESHSVPRQTLMFRFIDSGRADFILNEFSSEKDFGVTMDGIKLIPVPGIKVGLAGSRHFVVSKKFLNAHAIFEALQKGLKQLRAEGTIRKAYEESGFFDPRVKDWVRIFP